MKKIFLDKGHGGTDPGAQGNGLVEKDINYLIGEHTKWYLNKYYSGFQLMESRPGNETVFLQERTDMANAWGADVFLSIHVNSGGGTGFESFIYNGTVTNEDIALQNIAHAEILSTMNNYGFIRDRGKKVANFHVLRESRMPAVLTENLFIDDVNDAAKLKDKDGFLQDVGHAHARALAQFLGLPDAKYDIVIGYFPGSQIDKSFDQAQAAFPNWSMSVKKR
ncbi:N-acetylmuramoyl-L-alanine amidase [Virgibacillus halodenitrificans]|uniref:N-acetylmuramoyl-L-alanine amidase n=1 Tax=Virgibacillus halodenitrificans TaxID=1482 RepID=UPI001367BCA4|nr:N-acetylmuramoyl-L-alanine amidase [Virgibacillus halodenitrificans]MYL44578.1 N-acetylmuramoyl-L-alanine amidase [Virgibacillus halodenitrificans]